MCTKCVVSLLSPFNIGQIDMVILLPTDIFYVQPFYTQKIRTFWKPNLVSMCFISVKFIVNKKESSRLFHCVPTQQSHTNTLTISRIVTNTNTNTQIISSVRRYTELPTELHIQPTQIHIITEMGKHTFTNKHDLLTYSILLIHRHTGKFTINTPTTQTMILLIIKI